MKDNGVDTAGIVSGVGSPGPAGNRAKGARRGVLVGAAMLFGLGGCSMIPDWANPGSLYDSVFDDETSPSGLSSDAAAPGEEEDFPDLSSVPERPSEASSPEEIEGVRDGLIADRDSARYTDEDLRAGPADDFLAFDEVAPETPPETPQETMAPPRDDASEPREIARVDVEPRPLIEEVEPRAPSALGEAESLYDSLEPIDPSATVIAEPLMSEPTYERSPPEAEVATVIPATRVVPETSVMLETRNPAVTTVAGAGGQDSLAQTFAMRLAESSATVTTAPANPSFSSPASAEVAFADDVMMPDTAEAMGGAASGPSFGGAPGLAAIVKFANGSDRIGRRHRDALKKVVAAHRTRGGFIRVVGHASSRTRDLPLAEHMLVNFSISVDRAEAVARELIRLGAPPGSVLTEARGDSDPVYYEVMPAGEQENRRAEVFLEF